MVENPATSVERLEKAYLELQEKHAKSCDDISQMMDVDTSFCLGYHGLNAPKKKKKHIAKRRKVVQDDFQGGRFLSFNFGLRFDLLNVKIWTSPPASKLFKIKFSSQVVLNRAIFMDGLKAMD